MRLTDGPTALNYLPIISTLPSLTSLLTLPLRFSSNTWPVLPCLPFSLFRTSLRPSLTSEYKTPIRKRSTTPPIPLTTGATAFTSLLNTSYFIKSSSLSFPKPTSLAEGHNPSALLPFLTSRSISPLLSSLFSSIYRYYIDLLLDISPEKYVTPKNPPLFFLFFSSLALFHSSPSPTGMLW